MTVSAFKIITWGCQMNEDDSDQMTNILLDYGYKSVDDENDADIIILNTCSVRDKPEQKVRTKLGELRSLKEKNQNLIIAVCGCMAQRAGSSICKNAPFVDIIMGTADLLKLPSLIKQAKTGAKRITSIEMPKFDSSNGTSHIRRTIGNVSLKAFVPIMYGCNNYCTYCIVPYTRGPERSRLPDDIIDEITQLTANGCKEIMLVGQNVNSYGKTLDKPIDFADLLYRINDIPMLERIRFMTSHPKDLSDRLIDAIAELPAVCEQLHLPIQSGDDEILQKMGRKYTVDHYIELIQKLRSKVHGIGITTDIMVGFPGETNNHYLNTIKTVEDIKFDGAFMFAFNKRPGTKATEMQNQIDAKEKNERLRNLIAVQNEITAAKNRQIVGDTVEVLAENTSGKDSKLIMGYSRANKLVMFPYEPNIIGKLVNIHTVEAHTWGFTGELVRK